MLCATMLTLGGPRESEHHNISENQMAFGKHSVISDTKTFEPQRHRVTCLLALNVR